MLNGASIVASIAALLMAAAAPAAWGQACKLAVDVGHTRQNPGAISARGIGEWQFNSALATRLVSALQRAGVPAVLLNPDGGEISLQDRPLAARQAEATLLVSLHHDAVQPRYLSTWVWQGREQFFSDAFRGYGLFVSALNPEWRESTTVAMAIGDALLASGLRPSLHHAEQIPGEGRPLIDSRRGIYQFDNLVVLKEATMPAVLIEAGVIVHRDEELEVAKPDYQDRIVAAIVSAALGHCSRRN
jgi:N-acetylmuramoyl-L-alanine amidase